MRRPVPQRGRVSSSQATTSERRRGSGEPVHCHNRLRGEMGKVVKLEKPAQTRSGRRTRRSQSKTALVLGGGGFTGGVYEIGALRALDLLAVNSSVNQFDVYVGTSAGSFIAALCANGVTPEEMMRVVTRQGKPSIKEIDIGDLLRPNYG